MGELLAKYSAQEVSLKIWLNLPNVKVLLLIINNKRPDLCGNLQKQREEFTLFFLKTLRRLSEKSLRPHVTDQCFQIYECMSFVICTAYSIGAESLYLDPCKYATD